MGAQQRIYKQRIRSAQGMKKIFKAQEMIAASRIAKAHARVTATTPYAEAITRAIGSVATHSNEIAHPFLQAERQETGRVGILLITADRGMAGAYSPNAIRSAEQLANLLRDQGKDPVMYVVGRKGDSYYRFRNRPPHRSWTPYKEEELPDLGRDIAQTVTADLLSLDPAEHLDELYVVGTRFETRFIQKTAQIRLVPMGLVEAETGEHKPTYPLYDFAPDADTVVSELIPRYVESRIINILLQSMASEHASRQRAMKTATDNAETQIDKFTRLANTARQAEITQEITEIVGGADALSGSGRTER
ncbi:F0F1 ATP synthase subunit gamma [Brachybacterium sp. GCM10030267]|uniref:F0F1 ATP synthase subunit gamma n=1 Tax=unclassified Brachybacterium TaxID=2623841 RepID=UPI003610019D